METYTKNESKWTVNPCQGSVTKKKKNEYKPKLTRMGGDSAFGHPCSEFIFDTSLIFVASKIGAGESAKFQQLKLSRETETHIQVIFKLSSFLNVSPNKMIPNFSRYFVICK